MRIERIRRMGPYPLVCTWMREFAAYNGHATLDEAIYIDMDLFRYSEACGHGFGIGHRWALSCPPHVASDHVGSPSPSLNCLHGFKIIIQWIGCWLLEYERVHCISCVLVLLCIGLRSSFLSFQVLIPMLMLMMRMIVMIAWVTGFILRRSSMSVTIRFVAFILMIFERCEILILFYDT